MLRLKRLVVLNTKTLKNMSNVSITRSSSYSTKRPEITVKTTSGTVGDEVKDNKNKCLNDREINLFGPQDIRAPLKGNIGVADYYVQNSNIDTIEDLAQEINTSIFISNLVDTDLMAIDPHFRQLKAIRSFSRDELTNNESQQILDSMSSPLLECVAHKCPILLIRDFQDLFPISKRPDLTKGLTVITYCQKTVNDMSGWTKETDAEREELMGTFVSVAKNICAFLKTQGFWADFIDPSSGRPFLGEYTNATMFETDERYRHFGFTIEDLGCCKVISHHVWGTHAFVGAIFTDASIDSIEMHDVLSNAYKMN